MITRRQCRFVAVAHVLSNKDSPPPARGMESDSGSVGDYCRRPWTAAMNAVVDDVALPDAEL